MKKFVGLCALAVAVALVAVPAFAEVQNVKVSGDIAVKAISKDNWDLRKTTPGTLTNDDKFQGYLQTTGVRVDADLTDNVSAAVKLLNQRFWDTDSAISNDVDLELAYVKLKELVYSPLTVTVGRQDLKFGTGFIVGPGLLGDPNGLFAGTSATTTTVHAAGQAREYSAVNGYDAIRLTLDYAPLTFDYILAKIQERGEGGHDQDLMGANFNWKGAPVDRWQGEAELYWFWKNDRAAGVVLHDNPGRTYENNQVHTIGLRTAGQPVSNLWVNAEGAIQLGRLQDTVLVAGQGAQSRDRLALAADLSANYTFANAAWTPNLGLGWTYFSGEHAGGARDGDVVGAWDVMYRGSFKTAIQDFLGGTDEPGGLYTTFDPNDTSATTNRHLLYFDVGAKPLQDLALQARYTHAWFAKVPVSGRSSSAGDEVDLQAKWDYTEDVQLGLLGAAFLPGKYYDGAAVATRGRNAAWEVTGDLSVKF